jgi:hypothetical protein
MRRKAIAAAALTVLMTMSLAGCGEKAETVSASSEQASIVDEPAPTTAFPSPEENAAVETTTESAIVVQSTEAPVGDAPVGDGAVGDSYVTDGDEYATWLTGRYVCTNKNEESLAFEFFEDGTVDTPSDGSGTYYIDFDCNFTINLAMLTGKGNYDPTTDTIDFTFGYSVYHMERDKSYDNSDVEKNVLYLEGTYYCPEHPDPSDDLHFQKDGTVEQAGMTGTYHIDSDRTISVSFPIIGGSGTYNQDGSLDITVGKLKYHYIPDDRQ